MGKYSLDITSKNDPFINIEVEDDRVLLGAYEDGKIARKLFFATNSVNYISMKAKLTTSMWQYDILKMHTDSIMEVYNINKNYSRITSYE